VVKSDSDRQGNRVNFWELLKLILILVMKLAWFFCFRAEVSNKLLGFGGLVVRMLASGSRIGWFKPGRSRWIFLYIKILSMPSFGGEVK
jgi:hypothetical protein